MMINKINPPIVPTLQLNKTASESQTVSVNQTNQTSSFEDILKDQLGRSPTVRFSAHAQQRITSRNIDFGGNEAVRLEQAIEKAANKGSRESLILMDDLALVVSIKNKMVITAIDANSRKENIFTNIDSVVLT